MVCVSEPLRTLIASGEEEGGNERGHQGAPHREQEAEGGYQGGPHRGSEAEGGHLRQGEVGEEGEHLRGTILQTSGGGPNIRIKF